MVKFLIGQGASVHQMASYNTTAAHLAAEFGQLKILRYLLDEHHLDPFAKTEFDNTLLHKAAESGDMPTI
jgi:ankyrin repeat protein